MVFLDNASTTKPYDEVLSEVNRVNQTLFVNPSALYGNSVQLKTEMEQIRSNLVNKLGGSFFDSLIFTSGATEANNLAIRGALKKGGKLLVSESEHPSVYQTAKQLLLDGYQVEFVSLNNDGTVNLQDLITKLPGATVVSVMHVSNETGAINNIKEIVKLVKQHNPQTLVHSDGVQAFGKIAVNVQDLGVDMYTISGHKIHATKGIGALFIKKGVKLKPILFGGEHENGLRAGTENISGIFALNVAANLVTKNLIANQNTVLHFKQNLVEQLKQLLPQAVVIGNPVTSSPYILTVAVPGVKSETLLHLLEQKGFLVANGSACSSKNNENRVIRAMNLQNGLSTSSIRISFSESNTEEEITNFATTLSEVVKTYLNIVKK